MRTTRRDFLLATAASGAFASLPRRSWPGSPDDLQSKLAADPLRPQFHLLPAKNWMNDPNRPIFWNGASDAGSAQDFRLFLDASVAELIVDHRHAITSRIYRQPDGPLHIKIGNDSRLASFEGWRLPYLLRSPYCLTCVPASGSC